MMKSNEEFMDYISKKYPNVDWDNLPDIDTIKDIHIIQGIAYNEEKEECPFELDKEFASLKEAEEALEHVCSSMDNLVPHSLKIVSMMPSEQSVIYLYSGVIKRIKNGEKVFPLQQNGK